MSNGFSDNLIDEIKNKASIVDVISERIQLKRSGSTFKACCPFHNEKTPSFIVNPSRESYKCFGCGESGDVIQFIMKYDGLSFADAVSKLADKYGIPITYSFNLENSSKKKKLYSINQGIADFYKRCLDSLKLTEVNNAKNYLSERKITKDVIEMFSIGYAPRLNGTIEKYASKNNISINDICDAGVLSIFTDERTNKKRFYDRFKGRIIFPIHDTQDRIVGFSARILDSSKKVAKYVNTPETDIFVKSKLLYGLNKAQKNIVSHKHREAIICEGQIDVIRCHICGFNRAVASLGTAFTADHAKLLKRYADSAVLVFDQDAAGQKAALRTASILLSEKIPVRIAVMNVGDDPDSFLLSHKTEEFQKILDNAIGVVPFNYNYLSQKEDNPTSEGAIGRIVQGVLETISNCKNEIHKATMLQELSDISKIPFNFIEKEFTKVSSSQTNQNFDDTQTNNFDYYEASNIDDDINIPFDDVAVSIDNEIDFEEEGREKDISELMCQEYLDLCRLLVHSEENGSDFVDFLIKYIPIDIIDNDTCRRIISAFFDTHKSNGMTDFVYQLQSFDQEIAKLLGKLFVMPNKVTTLENFTINDLSKELVLAIWRRWCKSQKEKINGNMSERLSLMKNIKKLQIWETGEPIILAYLGEDIVREEVKNKNENEKESKPEEYMSLTTKMIENRNNGVRNSDYLSRTPIVDKEDLSLYDNIDWEFNYNDDDIPPEDI